MTEQQQDIFKKTLSSSPGFNNLNPEQQYQAEDLLYEAGTDINTANNIITNLRQDLIDGVIPPEERALTQVQISAMTRHKMQLLNDEPTNKPDSYILDPARPELPLGGNVEHQKQLMKGVENSAKWREQDSLKQKQQADKTKHEQQQQTVESHVKLGMDRDDAIKCFGGGQV